jgi:hypothetical protein
VYPWSEILKTKGGGVKVWRQSRLFTFEALSIEISYKSAQMNQT